MERPPRHALLRFASGISIAPGTLGGACRVMQRHAPILPQPDVSGARSRGAPTRISRPIEGAGPATYGLGSAVASQTRDPRRDGLTLYGNDPSTRHPNEGPTDFSDETRGPWHQWSDTRPEVRFARLTQHARGFHMGGVGTSVAPHTLVMLSTLHPSTCMNEHVARSLTNPRWISNLWVSEHVDITAAIRLTTAGWTKTRVLL
jgi:hypothetical protein